MRFLIALALTSFPAAACDAPVCLVDRDQIYLPEIVTFDDLPSGYGLGSRIDTVLDQPGARFGEHFHGQTRGAHGDHDLISGTARAPLTVKGGGEGETLGVMRLLGSNILLGHGPRKFPASEAVGEGAIAVLFTRDQAALGFDLRGGEAGLAEVSFLARDGRVIHRLTLGPIGEDQFTFARQAMQTDIAGILIQNTDAQGIAIDNLVFGLASPTS
ncbi:hypothetical protein [Aliiroseovarius sp.]|uniref:hypothetical protein n=1 Tax=Aliiroseovarius sp. TaxID=1872442 RepID=UPI003BAC0A9E